MGYSAGGDGAYQMTPRMADRWAAGAMMAGHPNNASAVNLRNIGMTLHMGGLDAAYSRNTLVVDFGKQIQSLQAEDPGYYKYQVKVYPDKPHWMDLLDAEALPWMADYTRQTHPKKVVWQQDTTVGSPISLTEPKVKDPPTQWRFYWIGRPDRKVSPRQAQVTAEIRGQEVHVEKANLDSVEVWLNDTLLDLDQPVTVFWKGTQVFEGQLARTTAMLWRSMEASGDRERVYPVRLVVSAAGLAPLSLEGDYRARGNQFVKTGQTGLSDLRGLSVQAGGQLKSETEARIWHNLRGQKIKSAILPAIQPDEYP
jgi:hypothetical protein